MQPFVAGALLGLTLGAVVGPRVLVSARQGLPRRPGRTEVWLTGALFALGVYGLFSLPEWLVPDPALVSLMNGFGCLAYVLLRSKEEAARWPLPIRLMQVFAGVLLLMIAARAAFPYLVDSPATPIR